MAVSCRSTVRRAASVNERLPRRHQSPAIIKEAEWNVEISSGSLELFTKERGLSRDSLGVAACEKVKKVVQQHRELFALGKPQQPPPAFSPFSLCVLPPFSMARALLVLVLAPLATGDDGWGATTVAPPRWPERFQARILQVHPRQRSMNILTCRYDHHYSIQSVSMRHCRRTQDLSQSCFLTLARPSFRRTGAGSYPRSSFTTTTGAGGTSR